MHGGKVNEMNAKYNNKDGFYPHYIKRVDENFYLYYIQTEMFSTFNTATEI